MSVKCIVRDFLSSTALYLLRNDIEGHKKEAYIRPICFIRELQQSQKLQAIGSFRFFLFFLLIKISKTLLRTDCTFMMTHAFRSDSFDVAARLRDDSQRRFLAQHSVATLLRHGFEQLQYCSNIATLCCAKNRLCKSSRVTSP